jgi:TonB family protein
LSLAGERQNAQGTDGKAEEDRSANRLGAALEQPTASAERSAETSQSTTHPPSSKTTSPGAKTADAAQAGGGTSAFETLVEDARILHLERPMLPEGIYASGLEGQVVVQVDIDRDGNPRQAKILRSTNDLLEPAVIDAVNRSQFSPRKMSSGPVNSSLTIPFTFRTKR